MDIKFLGIRIAVIIVAICTGFVIYHYIFKPYVLEQLCFINSNACLRLTYYSYNNSALIQMPGSDVWVWYNGEKAFIYGQPVGRICKYPGEYEPVYTINTKTGLKEGYNCVQTLKSVMDFYKNKDVKPVTLVKKIDTQNFDIYGVLNYLNSEGIINL